MAHRITMLPDQPENLLFYMISAYVFTLYGAVVFSNPGHINEKQKRIINQKFYKLEQILEKQKIQGERFRPQFESKAEEIVFNNYFSPLEILQQAQENGGQDMRKNQQLSCLHDLYFYCPNIHFIFNVLDYSILDPVSKNL
eukprot:403365003